MKPKIKTFSQMAFWISLVGILFWPLSSRERNYLISTNELLLSCTFIGVIVAALVYWLLYKRQGYPPQVTNRLASFTVLWVGCALFIASVAAKLNEAYASDHVRKQRSLVLSKRERTGRAPSRSISCQIQHTAVDFTVPPDLWDAIAKGDTVTLCIKTGALGYNFVDEIMPATSSAP